MSATAPSTRLRFYQLIAFALAAFIIIGFSRTYYLRVLSDLPPLRAVLQLHGFVFTAWLALFIAQTQLIAAHRIDLHMKLGIAGVALAIVSVAVAVAVIFVAAATPRVHNSGLTSAQASIVGLASLAQFAIPVTAGVLLRRRASLHKRFMLLAMIGALGPPTARFAGLLGAGKFGYVLQMGVIAVFIGCCLVHDWRKSRVVHPVFAIGGLAMIVSWPLRYIVGRSEWWQPIANWIAKMGTFLVS